MRFSGFAYLFGGMALALSMQAGATALDFSFSGKSTSSIGVTCHAADGLSVSASFIDLVSVNNSTGAATATAVALRSDATTAGAATLFSPNVNVQTASGWQATFSCTPGKAFFVKSLGFEAFSFNSSGAWQDGSNVRAMQYRVDILKADGTSLLLEHDSAWKSQVDLFAGGVMKPCRVDFARPVLIQPNSPFKFRISVKCGTQTLGSFFGLKSMTLSIDQDALEMFAVNFLGIRTGDDYDRGLGLPVAGFGGHELGVFPLAAERWNDVDAYDSASAAVALSAATGAPLETTIWRNKRWAVNNTYLNKAAVAAKTYSAEQALFYGYTDNASAIAIANIPYSAYTLCLYYTSGNTYTEARTFPPALIEGVYYSGKNGTTASAATSSVWGDHRYSFANPSFGTGSPEYKEGYNTLIIRGQTASTLVITTPSAASPTFGGIAAIQVIKEYPMPYYADVYTAQVSTETAWENVNWQVGYKEGVALPGNLTNATVNVIFTEGSRLTLAESADPRGANLTLSGTGMCAFSGDLACSTLTLQDTEGKVDVVVSGTLRLTGTEAPDRASLEVAAPNTFTLGDAALLTRGRLTAPIRITGDARIEGGATLAGATLVLDGGKIALADSHTIGLLSVTADSIIDTSAIDDLTIRNLTASNGSTLTLTAFTPGTIRFATLPDLTLLYNTFRLKNAPKLRFIADSTGELIPFNTGTRIILH